MKRDTIAGGVNYTYIIHNIGERHPKISLSVICAHILEAYFGDSRDLTGI